MAVKRYNGSAWVTEAGGVPALPSGMLAPYAGTTAPTGWLLADGGTFSATAYPALAAVLGDTYGTHSGDNYYKPDLRGRVPAGKDNMGGSTASRLTSATSGITGTTLGAAGGDEKLHQHSHPNTLSDAGHYHDVGPRTLGLAGSSEAGTPDFVRSIFTRSAADSNSTAWRAFPATSNVTITNANNSQTGASQNVQPTIILNYIIKT